jgi:hypothetical protein
VTDWFSNDPLFRRELEAGHHWASLVAARLMDAGLDARLTPVAWRETIDDRHRFADERDIEVHAGTEVVSIEAKSRRLAFTEDPATYPYATALVDTVSGWDQKIVKPKAVVLVSRETEAMLVVPVRTTQPRWTVKTTRDRVRNSEDRWYQCPKSLLLPFATLVAWLERSSPPLDE